MSSPARLRSEAAASAAALEAARAELTELEGQTREISARIDALAKGDREVDKVCGGRVVVVAVVVVMLIGRGRR